MRALALVAALSLLFALPVSAKDQEPPALFHPEGTPPWSGDPDITDITPEFSDQLWFIEFASDPTIRGGQTATLAQERNALYREAREQAVSFEQRFDFQRLWNGISVKASPAEAAAITTFASTAAVYPVELIDLPEPDEVAPDLATALTMTGADVVASELGLTGDGLSVAIVDTGIDYGHPDLGGGGPGTEFPTARVTHGFDYVGDDYDASDPERDVPDPNPDPMDISGHGTHVAGIVGASPAGEDGATGVAPDVTFGAYKVFGTEGSSSADVIIAALEDAHADGMDIVNMSLGAAFAWGEYPTSQVSNTLVEQGTVVVVSAGNSGGNGVFSLGAPGNASDVIGVASADNLQVNARLFGSELGSDGAFVPYLELPDAELPPTEGESDPVAITGDLEDPARYGCSSGDFDDFPEGNVALISRGGEPDPCTFNSKYQNAVDAGATGVVIYNSVQGLFAGGGVSPEEGIWGVGISDVDGASLVTAIAAGEDVTLDFTEEERLEVNPTGGMLSSFSSYGMTPDLQFRPDITAPGGLINSTYPLASGGYAMLSGTSMSAPHVAGGVALLLEARPDLDASEVRPVLQNSADPIGFHAVVDVDDDGNPIVEFLYDETFRQGAGMLQIDRAITATTSVSPNRIELGESEVTKVDLTITNSGEEAVKYHLGHGGSLGTGGLTAGESVNPLGPWATIFFPQLFLPTTAASLSPETVTIGAGESAEVTATIANPDFGLYAHQAGGFLTVTEDGADTPTAVVPYAGLAGNLADIEIWPDDRPAAVGLPNHLVAMWTQGEDGDLELVAAEPGHIFDARAGEEPVAAVFMGFAAQRVEVTAVHESGHEVPVAAVDFARRSVTPGEYPAYTWDGKEQVGNSPTRRFAPSGEYFFSIRALPVGADPGDAGAWQEAESYEFNLEAAPEGPGRGGNPPGGPPGRGPGGNAGGPR